MKILAALKYWDLHLNDPSYQSNFQSRKLLQKLTYICKSLKIQMDYNFSLYIHGPYCTALADDYYEFHNNVPKKSTTYEPENDEIEIYKKIKEYIFSHSLYNRNRVEFLEAIATIMYLKDINPDLLDDEIFENTKINKPYLSDRIIIIANNVVKQLLFKPEYLTDELKEELELWDRAED